MQHLSNLDNRFGQGFAPDAAWLEQAVTTGEASRMIGVAVATPETWRSRGGGPPYRPVIPQHDPRYLSCRMPGSAVCRRCSHLPSAVHR